MIRFSTERRRGPEELHPLAAFLLLQLLAVAVDCLFLDTSSAVIRGWRPSAQAMGSKSLFGYRVAAIKNGADIYLLVSDPVGYNAYTKTTSGTVEKCQISARDFNTTGPICPDSALPFDFANPDNDSLGFVEFSQFGASLASLPDGQFAVCAPGHNFVSIRYNHTATPGLCGYWRNASAQPVWLQKFLPYLASSKDERMFGNCLGGFQVVMSTVLGVTRLTVSGPFCMRQQLAEIKLSDTYSLPEPKLIDTGSSIRNNYLGYSLSADPDSGTVFAASPNVQYDSRILLARIRSIDPPAADLLDARIGRPFYDYLYRSFGYIGYSSAVISVSALEARKALVLGAPFYSDGTEAEELDLGCVFVLPLEEADGTLIDGVDRVPTRYCGVEAGGRLGTAVVGIGDVNYDGLEDFAVGCPGCGVNGTGAIYLFLGYPDYANPPGPLTPFEVIRAPDILPQLSGFGWSLAVAPDVDGNMVNELIAGAVTSRHVVVLPGRLLLDTGLSFYYSDTPTEEFVSDVPMNQFHRSISRSLTAVINMRTKSGVNLTSYRFNLHVQLDELAETEPLRRFDIELLGCPSSDKGWCRLDRLAGAEANAARFKFNFRLKPLLNIERHVPPQPMLRNLSLRVRWRITDRFLPSGSSISSSLFPALLYERRVFPGYEDAFDALLYKFKTGICETNFGCSSTGNLRLILHSKPSIILNSYNQIKVILRVQKTSSYPFYGGAAIRLMPSPGVYIRDNVTLQEVTSATGHQNGTQRYVRYWSDHKEILLTEPFPDPPDVMTSNRRGQIQVSVRLNFDAKRINYRVNFTLVNLLGDIAGWRDHVTRDTNKTDNWVSLEINFNTSLELQLFSTTEEAIVADARESASESQLQALSGTSVASVIGPGLQHTYELMATTKPAASVRDLSILVRLPLVTTAGQLLLYFPKNAIASHVMLGARLVSQYLPGVPFTSDDSDGFERNRECYPLEADLSRLLAKPPLVLLEKQHGVNASYEALGRNRRSVGGPDLKVPPQEFKFVTPLPSPTSASPPPPPPPPQSDEPADPTFDCDQPQLAPMAFHCITFRCDVRELGNNDTLSLDKVYLHIHARLWSPTYFKKHLGRFNIRSSASLEVSYKDQPFRNIETAGNSSVEQTFLLLGVRPRIVDRIPWGYIILAIFLGIWLLLLLILLLWYCNFFRRKRYNEVPQNDNNEDDDFYR